MWTASLRNRVRAAGAIACALASAGRPALGGDLGAVVARAREQVERGAYADALETLSELPASGVPATLAVEAALLETTATLVVKGEEGGEAACAKAVVASGYDPEVAREQSPKVRAACRAAATAERRERAKRAGVTLSALAVEKPEVAWQPVRISVAASGVPAWLRVAARVTSTALEGSFDVALAPSVEGPLRGTLDPSFIRPRATVRIELVALDKFGDLGQTGQSVSVEVPAAEALIALGELPAGAVVTIDGAAMSPGPGGRAPVRPGSHEVALELEDGAAARATVAVKRGTLARVGLSPQKQSGGKTLAWLATGTSVALGAVGTVLLLVADSRRSEIEELAAKREPGTNLPATSYDEVEARDDERRTFATVGTGLLIGAGATAAAAVTLWLWPEPRAPRPAKPPPRGGPPPGMHLVPVVGLGTLGVHGRY